MLEDTLQVTCENSGKEGLHWLLEVMPSIHGDTGVFCERMWVRAAQSSLCVEAPWFPSQVYSQHSLAGLLRVH